MYEEMFKNKCSKKFLMILKKHTNQMDMYDNKLLNDYIRKINEI